MDSIRILGIAFEPWETEIVAASILKLRGMVTVAESALLIGDIWQIKRYSAIKNLERIKKEYDITAYSLEEEFLSWQYREFADSNDSYRIYKWAIEKNLSRSTRVLALSDHIFSCYERSPYYLPLISKEKEAILYSQYQKVSSVINDFDPNLILCIDTNYLIKNIVADLAKSQAIRMMTLINSRVNNYYYFTDNFGLGSSPKLCERLKVIPKNSLEFAESFAKSREKQDPNSQNLYSGMTESILEQLIRAKQKPLKSVLSNGLFAARDLFRRIIERDRSGIPNTNRYGSDWRRVWIYVLMNYLRKSRFILFGIPNAIKSVPDFPYIYYPLHYRPENSTLTLGNGADDESAIEFICRRLPYGLKLAIKENPSMVGDRRSSFYRKFMSVEGVVLVDPLVSTAKLADKSLGVIGISGTALLEAGLKGIPSHAIGEPEFKEFLTSSGFDSVEKFLVDCTQQKAQSCKESLIRYLALIFEWKIDVQLGWDAVSSKENIDLAANNIADGLVRTISYENS